MARTATQYLASCQRLLTNTPRTRFLFLCISATILLFTAAHVYLTSGHDHSLRVGPLPSTPESVHDELDLNTSSPHPIDDLIRSARAQWTHLLSQQSHNLSAASAQYTARRGRHPPPGFAAWFAYAQKHDVVMIEELWDQIYDDLRPYWGLEPSLIRELARSFEPRISIRNHTMTSQGGAGPGWMEAWTDIVSLLKDELPDLDMPINGMDESRIILPWDVRTAYETKEEESRRRFEPHGPVFSKYAPLPPPINETEVPWHPPSKGLGDGPFFDIVRVACAPDSPAQKQHIPHIDFAHPPPELQLANYLNNSYHGYVNDWERARDPCARPELQALHGSFIEPVSVSTTHELFPLFGGSKLAVNNEILIPAAMYWADNERYSGGEGHGGAWEKKTDRLVWRGVASGGRNKVDTWTGFQRHRLLSMLNATEVQRAEKEGHGAGENFLLPDYETYQVEAGIEGQLPSYLDEHADAGFLDLLCDPADTNPHCPYTDPHFALVDGMPMATMYQSKYLPDIDGNSFSGRYKAFLLSTSLPLKATVYYEWHHSRLIPWAHFVPLDTSYVDVYGVMSYFMGFKKGQGRDGVARKIALDGKSWAEKVLRKEDMLVYVWRLLLEYARLGRDEREQMGERILK